MGNYASCALAGAAGSRSVKVVFPGGEIRTFKEQPLNAAELMLELPNFFVVNARSLEIGRSFYALNADEDLVIGNVYVLFPMKKLSAVIRAADLGGLFLAAKRNSKSKVAPMSEAVEETAAPEKMNLKLPQYGHSRALPRSKKPGCIGSLIAL